VVAEGFVVIDVRLKTQAVGLRPPFVGLAGLADGVAGQILVAVLVGVVVGDLGESRQAVDNVPLEVEVGRGAAGGPSGGL